MTVSPKNMLLGNRANRKSGVTTFTVLKHIPKDAMVKIFPTAAGTAIVYTSGSPMDLVDLDAAAGAAAIAASTNANWDQWGAGSVTAETIGYMQCPASALALVVSSGTWVLEVCN